MKKCVAFLLSNSNLPLDKKWKHDAPCHSQALTAQQDFSISRFEAGLDIVFWVELNFFSTEFNRAIALLQGG